MGKQWLKIKKYRFEIVYGVLAVIAVFSPYIRQDLIMGSDAPFHLARIESLAEGIREGIFPVKIHTVLCYSYGYGVGFFYPNLFLYIPAVFRALGCSLEIAYKLYAGILFIGIFVSMYVCVCRAMKDRALALMAGALFLFSHPVLSGFYHGFTLAQNQALVFLPPAIMGMFEFAASDRKPGMLAFGFTGLIYSHTLSTVMAVGVCTVILLGYAFRWGQRRQWKKKLFQLAAAVLGVSCLTMAYWGPMFEQFAVQNYKVTQPWTHVYQNVPTLYRVLTSEGMGSVLVAATVMMLPSVLCGEKRFSGEGKLSLFLGTGLMLIISCRTFWNNTGKLFDVLQFPVRLAGPATVLIIFAVAFWLREYDLHEKLKNVLVLVILGISICTGLGTLTEDIENTENWDGRVIYEEIAGIGAGEEWLPVETTREVMVNPLTAFSAEGEAFAGNRIGKDYYFEVDGTSESYEMPLVWYRGYRAENTGGKQLDVTKNPDNSLVVVKNMNPESKKTTIHVWYAGTFCQKFSYAVSLITLAGVIVYGFVRKRRCNRYAI